MFEIEAGAFQRANGFNEKDNQVFHTEKKKGEKSQWALEQVYLWYPVLGLCYLIFPFKFIFNKTL